MKLTTEQQSVLDYLKMSQCNSLKKAAAALIEELAQDYVELPPSNISYYCQLESILIELVDKILPEFDSGDLIADADVALYELSRTDLDHKLPFESGKTLNIKITYE